MKTLGLLAFLLLSDLSSAIEIEPLGHLPFDTDKWSIVDRGDSHREDWICRWMTLRNKEDGSLFSIRMDRYVRIAPPTVSLGGAWTEMPLNFPGGHHLAGKKQDWEDAVGVWSSSELADLGSGQRAVRSQTYWKHDEQLRLAHGLAFAMDMHFVYLQHTSEKVFTPEFVRSVADRLLSTKRTSEQDGADQPATALEAKSEGDQQPKPESEERSQ